MKKKPGRKSHAQRETELDALFTELKGEYLDSFPEKIEAIKTFWQARDRKGLQNEFHKMKGTGTTYGLPEISALAEILEDMCDQKGEKLGASIIVCLELMDKICKSHKFKLEYDLYKDPLFLQLKVFYEQLQLAS